MPDDAQQLPTLSNADQAALQRWVRQQGIGSTVTDLRPLTGGTQNIVVRLTVDGRPLVLRRPPVAPAAQQRPHHAARDRGADHAGRQFGAASPIRRRLRGPRRPRCRVLSDGGRRRLQPRHRGEPTPMSGTPVMRHRVGLSTTPPTWPGSATPRGEACRSRHCSGRDPFWHARFRSFLPCSKATGTTATGPTYSRSRAAGRLAGGQPAARRRARHHARRRAPQQRAAAAGNTRGGGVHRLGDVHDWRPAARSRLDAGLLAARPDPINAGSQLAALGGLASRRELLDAYRAAGGRETSRLDWYLAMACFKLGIVIEGT